MRKRISGLMALVCLLVAAASALAAGTTVTTFTPFADMDFAAQGYMDLITAWEDETGNMVEDYSGLEDDLFMEQMQEMVTAGRADLVVVPLGSGLTKDQLVSVDELLARLRVALRRARQDSGHAGAPEAVFTNGELTIDYAAGCTYLAGQEVHLTPIEYKLLCLLAKNVGKVLTHNFILKEVWGSALPGDTPSLRVFMATLRKKIEPVPAQPKYIQTHVGVGYRMLRIAEGEPVQKNG